MRTIDESREGYITMDELQPLIEAKLDALRKEFGDLKNLFIEFSIELKGDLDAHFVAGLGDLNTRFAELAGALKRDADVHFVVFTGNMNTQFAEFKGEMRDELHASLQDIRQEIQDIRLEIRRGIRKLIVAAIATVAATFAIIEGLKALFA